MVGLEHPLTLDAIHEALLYAKKIRAQSGSGSGAGGQSGSSALGATTSDEVIVWWDKYVQTPAAAQHQHVGTNTLQLTALAMSKVPMTITLSLCFPCFSPYALPLIYICEFFLITSTQVQALAIHVVDMFKRVPSASLARIAEELDAASVLRQERLNKLSQVYKAHYTCQLTWEMSDSA
jgi:hypothetical protein